MNRMIELHDSELIDVGIEGGMILTFAPMYIHASEGVPGVDSGTVWIQRANLVIGNAVGSDISNILPCKVYDGQIVAGGVSHDNMIPIPLEGVGDVAVRLLVNSDAHGSASLELSGTSARIELIGKSWYLEEFPGMDRPVTTW